MVFKIFSRFRAIYLVVHMYATVEVFFFPFYADTRFFGTVFFPLQNPISYNVRRTSRSDVDIWKIRSGGYIYLFVCERLKFGFRRKP